jgi:hypothetical protein
MLRLQSDTSIVRSTSRLYGEFQIVGSSGGAPFGLKARAWDAEGLVHRNRTLAHLSRGKIIQLCKLLSDAVVVAETAERRQRGLWPETPRHGRLL